MFFFKTPQNLNSPLRSDPKVPTLKTGPLSRIPSGKHPCLEQGSIYSLLIQRTPRARDIGRHGDQNRCPLSCVDKCTSHFRIAKCFLVAALRNCVRYKNPINIEGKCFVITGDQHCPAPLLRGKVLEEFKVRENKISNKEI